MFRAIGTAESDRILPEGTGPYVRRRLRECAGLFFSALAVLLVTALVSYSPTDPSFNHATGDGARNLLGRPGSYAADLALQSVGLAALVLALAFLAWSWQLLRGRRVAALPIRLVLLAAAVALWAIGLDGVPTPGHWPLVTGLGGVVGAVGADLLTSALAEFGRGRLGLIISATGASLGTVTLIAAGGLSRSDWVAAWTLLRPPLGAVVSIGRLSLERLRRRIRERNRIEPSADTATGNRDTRRAPGAGPPLRTGLVAPRRARPKSGRRAEKQRQRELDLEPVHEYRPPPLDLFAKAPPTRGGKDGRNALQQNALLLAGVLDDFGVKGQIVKVRPGPVVALYELEPAPGTKTARVIGLAADIARSMSAVSVRVAVVPGRNAIGIELPNVDREMVYLSELLASATFDRSGAKLPLALGKDIGGAPVLVDLARMPHLLIAGTTGSGKSVAMNTMVLSLLSRLSPDQCRLIMIDPKMLELSIYDGIPHLLTPVVTEPLKAIVALKWAVREMEERYRVMSRMGVRNIAGYNARLEEARKTGETLTRRVQTGFDDDGKPVFEEQALSMEPLPFIVVVVDEMADLMLVAGKDVEAAIQRLAQMARAAGIHLIMATQRPSVDVITGTIKANFPTRISFQVTSKVDSRTILGEQGAEQLLGQGDMLYMAGGGRITRLHGAFVADEEVEAVAAFLKSQGEPTYLVDVTEDVDATEGDPFGQPAGNGSGDTLYDQAVVLVTREGKASTSFIQRYLQIGYNRAARIIETMETEGLVSSADRVGRREVLVGRGPS